MLLGHHYLGPSFIDNMALAAEANLETSKYLGETKRWNFESYVKVHLECHQILNDLKTHGFSGIDEKTKVRKFMMIIKIDALNSVKKQILANTQVRADLTACVGLCKDFIYQSASSSTNSSLHISSLDTSEGNGGGRNSGNRIKRKQTRGQLERTPVPCEDRYYDKKEYGKLSSENKMWLKL